MAISWAGVRTRILVAGAVASSAIAIAVPFTSGGGGGVTCDQTVTTSAALNSAVGTTASAGDTICVTANITGSRTWTVDQPSRVRVIAQPADMTIDMGSVNFQGASNLTLEGFELNNAGISFTSGAQNNAAVGNRVHDLNGSDAFVLNSGSGAVSGIDILGNLVEDIHFVNGSGGGYGVNVLSGASDVSINYNTFDMANSNSDAEISADGMQLDLTNFELIGNVIKNVHGSPYDGNDPRNPHADGLMIWDESSNGLIKDNRIIDTTGTLISPDGQNLVFENNLIARVDQQCVDATQNGSSGNVIPLNFDWIRNTLEGCGTGGLHTNGSTIGARGGSSIEFNVIEELSCEGAGPTQYTLADHNLVDTNGCAVSGTNNLNFTPTFADTINYLPTNLPAGYESAGYRDAPAGHLERP